MIIRILPILISSLYTGILLLFGMSVLQLTIPRERWADGWSTLVFIPSGFLLGQCIIGQVWLFLGLAARFEEHIIWLVLVISLVIGMYSVPRYSGGIRDLIKRSASRLYQLPFYWKSLCFILAIFLILTGMKSIWIPPSGDAEAFYMVFPKIMAVTGILKPQPNYYDFSQIGLFGELHYAALMSISTPQAAKFFTWFTFLAMAALLVSLCTYMGMGLRGHLIALIMLCSSSTVTTYITDGKVDIYGGALGLAAYYWAFRSGRTEGMFPIVLAGVFAGFACVAKFSNLPVILGGIGLIVLWNLWIASGNRSDHMKIFVRRSFFTLGLIGMLMLAAFIPHLIKNAMLFGEPFAPFYFLKGSGNQWVNQVWFSPDTTKYILFTYPLALIFGQYPMQEGNLSALMLAFLPLVFFLPKPVLLMENRLFQLTVTAILCTMIWVIIRPAVIAPRYILASLLLFIPVVAAATEYFLVHTDSFKIVKVTVSFSLVFALMLFIIQYYMIPARFVRYLTGRLQTCEFSSGYCPALAYVNSTAPTGCRIYVGGYYAYHLRSDLLQDVSGPLDEAGSNLPLQKRDWGPFYKQGFRYIVIQKESQSMLLKILQQDQLPPWLTIRTIYEDPHSIVFSLHHWIPDSTIQNPVISPLRIPLKGGA
jgi:hypothetical protein